MAVTNTSKLNLALPDDDENGDVEVINENMRKIDAAMPTIIYQAGDNPPSDPVEGTIWLKPI